MIKSFLYCTSTSFGSWAKLCMMPHKRRINVISRFIVFRLTLIKWFLQLIFLSFNALILFYFFYANCRELNVNFRKLFFYVVVFQDEIYDNSRYIRDNSRFSEASLKWESSCISSLYGFNTFFVVPSAWRMMRIPWLPSVACLPSRV